MDEALVYRVDISKILAIGAMAQFRDDPDNQGSDVFGVSARLNVGKLLRIGASYTRKNLNQAVQASLSGARDGADYIATGATLATDKLQVGAVFGRHKSGNLIRTEPDEPDIAYDAIGFELFAKYQLGALSPIGGVVLSDPDSGEDLLNPDFKTQYLILGPNGLSPRTPMPALKHVLTTARMQMGTRNQARSPSAWATVSRE